MSNLITKTTELAMRITLSYVEPGDTVIDATCGTGQDTLALAEAVGDRGKVYAFDIQKEAIGLTSELLKSNGCMNVELFNESFVYMGEHVPEGSASAAVFNLGYLPDGNKSITTKTDSTLTALKKSLEMIRVNGLVSIVMYWGHEEGKKERQAILDFSEKLDSGKYHCVYLNMLNQKNCPPEIILITKKK